MSTQDGQDPPSPKPLPTDNPTLPDHPFDSPPTSPNLSLYTPSAPCLHCTLLSARCSLQNLHEHRHARKTKALPPPRSDIFSKYMYNKHRDSTWDTYRYYSNHPHEPIRRLETRCRRCVRDGVWCVLRQVGGVDEKVIDGLRGGDGDEEWGEGIDEATHKAGNWVQDRSEGCVKVKEEATTTEKEKTNGPAGQEENTQNDDVDVRSGVVTREICVDRRDSGGNKQDWSSSPAVRTARRNRRVGNLEDFEARNLEGSTGKASASRKPTMFKRYRKASLSPPRRNSTSPDFVDYDADADSDNTDLNSGSDSDHDSDLDFDIKSNVSSKTSFARWSIKSTTSPLLTPSPSPAIQHPEPPLLPPPEPVEPIPDCVPENQPWNWETKGCNENNTKPKRKPFTREIHTSTHLFAAITAVEVTKSDLTNLLSPSSSFQTGTHRFLTSKLGKDITFVAYVRSPGLSPGPEGQGQLLQIVRSQILDAVTRYERTKTRKKEGLGLVEGFLPLESRLGNRFLTQEDIQKHFALPSWQIKKMEFLSEGMVEMRRRKGMEEIRERMRLEQKREDEEMIRGWKMEEEKRRREEEMVRRSWRVGEMEAEGQEEEENGDGDGDQPFKESIDPIPNGVDTEPREVQPDPELDPDPDSDPEPIPSTPSSYFSLRLSRLHHFWTNEAQPIDFEFAKIIKLNTFHKWRGEKLEPFNPNWIASTSTYENNQHGEVGVTTTGWGEGIDESLDILDSIPSVLDQRERQKQKATNSISITGAGVADGDKLAYQGLADAGLFPFRPASRYPPSEPEWRFVADDMAVLSDVGDDEDILRLIGNDSDEDDDGDDDVGDGKEDERDAVDRDDEEEEEDENLDSHPLIDYFRASMMNND